MLRRIVFAALAGGLAGGILITAIQAVKILPLIAQAEIFEAGGGTPASSVFDSARIGLTLLANSLAGIGFALLLSAALAWRRLSGVRNGLAWGMAGYIVFSLAPALGLPPELPGMAAGDLIARQMWWAGTVGASAAGLALIALAPGAALKCLGAVIMAAPHIVGAPHPPPGVPGAVPAELAAAFAVATLMVNLIFWAAIGAVAGHMLKRTGVS